MGVRAPPVRKNIDPAQKAPTFDWINRGSSNLVDGCMFKRTSVRTEKIPLGHSAVMPTMKDIRQNGLR
jgi:hypothetical protein